MQKENCKIEINKCLTENTKYNYIVLMKILFIKKVMIIKYFIITKKKYNY